MCPPHFQNLLARTARRLCVQGNNSSGIRCRNGHCSIPAFSGLPQVRRLPGEIEAAVVRRNSIRLSPDSSERVQRKKMLRALSENQTIFVHVGCYVVANPQTLAYLIGCDSPGAESAMENTMNNQGRGVLPRRAPSNSADAMGLWFAALVLCAVFAAGVMIYQSGNTDVVVTAANNTAPPAAH